MAMPELGVATGASGYPYPAAPVRAATAMIRDHITVGRKTMKTVKTVPFALAFALIVTLGACGQTTGERSGSGMLMGAAGGAALGAIAGNAALGAGIGAGVGLVGGFLYDQHKKGSIN